MLLFYIILLLKVKGGQAENAVYSHLIFFFLRVDNWSLRTFFYIYNMGFEKYSFDYSFKGFYIFGFILIYLR